MSGKEKLQPGQTCLDHPSATRISDAQEEEMPVAAAQ